MARGRPPKLKPELLHRNMETLDLCLKSGLISEYQYRYGLRLRWLHSLFFGSGRLKAKDLSDGRAFKSFEHDEKWLELRYVEYKEMLQVLASVRARAIVEEICIYDKRLDLELHNQAELCDSAESEYIAGPEKRSGRQKLDELQLSLFRVGMAALEKHYCSFSTEDFDLLQYN